MCWWQVKQCDHLLMNMCCTWGWNGYMSITSLTRNLQCSVKKQSKYNASIWCVTALMPVAPLMPPVGVEALVLSATSVLVSWSDSWSASDSAAMYTVRCGRRTLRGRYRYVNVSTMTTRFDELRPYTEYEISVRVSRAGRQSTWSMSVLVTTKHARTLTSLHGTAK